METKQIFSLIPKIMADVGAVAKTRKNQQQGYSFRGIDDLYLALHGPLSTHGVFYASKVLKRDLRAEGVTAATWDAEAAGVSYERR